MKSCSMKGCIISVIAVFVFMFGYDFVIHGILLEEAYKATARLWRTEAEMQALWPLCIVYHLSLAVLFAALYKKICNCDKASCGTKNDCSGAASTETAAEAKRSIKGGICFGVIIGLIMAVINGSAYMHLPMPAALAITWFIASLLQGVGVGVVLALINNKKSCSK